MRYLLLSLLALAVVPQAAFAVEPPEDFKGLVGIFLNIIDYLVPLVFVLTFMLIVWGVVRTWIMSPGEQEQVESGKRLVLVGVIVLVLTIGIWGILRILRYTFFGLV